MNAGQLRTAGVESAYRICEGITRAAAKNFAYGIRLLAPPERQALSVVYALARRIDDIGDGDDPPEKKLTELATVRKQLDRLLASPESGGADPDPVMVALADAARGYDLPIGAFIELIDGCEMDVHGTAYETFDELIVYCRRVGGSIGRLSFAVFRPACERAGLRPADAQRAIGLADDLGIALQLTNILRDVVEDRARGRVYLPATDAATVGCPPDLSGPAEAIAALVHFECEKTAQWFERGWRLLPMLDHRSRACVATMAGIYRRLLARIERDPLAVTRSRVSLPVLEKAWVAARSLVGVGS